MLAQAELQMLAKREAEVSVRSNRAGQRKTGSWMHPATWCGPDSSTLQFLRLAAFPGFRRVLYIHVDLVCLSYAASVDPLTADRAHTKLGLPRRRAPPS